MLRMKSSCEKCKTSLGQKDTAYICSFECTFCQACSDDVLAVCPNCSGELVRRPRRTTTPINAAISQIKKKLFPVSSD